MNNQRHIFQPVAYFTALFLLLVALLMPGPVSAHTSSSESLEITETYIRAPFDKVPRFCNPPNIPASSLVTSVRSGSWSDASIWSSGEVPGDDAKVHITESTTVAYDVDSNNRLDCIEIHGNLTWALDRNTKLYINEITVMPTGSLTIGTPSNPLPGNLKAEIIYNDTPLKTGTIENPGIDPQMYGKGLIVTGDITIHGAEKSPTFVRLAKEPKANDTTLITSEPLSGWQVGDELVLPDTRANRLRDGSDSQRERLTVQSVNSNTITLATPLTHDHLCARDADEASSITTLSNGESLCAHVGNLTRNIIFRSESTEPDRRGHTLFLHRSDMDVRYALFKDLGRTKNIPINNSKFDESGKLASLGTNQIGRYPFHVHHVWGPRNPTDTGYQAEMVGNVVDGGLKWMMTIHDTHYTYFAENIVHDGGGAGIATEDGSESYNLFEHNFVVGMGGNRNDGSHPFEGTVGDGFWSAGANNLYRNNVSADLTRNGTSDSANTHTYGFVVWGGVAGKFNSDENRLTTIPKIRGANMFDSAETEKVQIACDGGCGDRAIDGYIEFSGNEAYGGMNNGLATPIGGLLQRVSDFRAWNFQDIGLRAYDTHFDVDGLILRGQGKGMGIWSYSTPTIKNFDIQNVSIGIQNIRSSTHLQNGFFQNAKNIDFLETGTSGRRRIGTFSNVTFDKPANVLDEDYRLATTDNTVKNIEFFIEQMNGDETKDYQVHTESTAPCDHVDCEAARKLARDLHIDGLLVPVQYSGPAVPDAFTLVAQYPLAEETISTENPTVGFSMAGGTSVSPGAKINVSLAGQTRPLVKGTVFADTPNQHTFDSVPPGDYLIDLWLTEDGNGQEIPGSRITIPVIASNNPLGNEDSSAPAPPTITTAVDGYTVKLGELLTFPITFTNPGKGALDIVFPGFATMFPGATIE